MAHSGRRLGPSSGQSGPAIGRQRRTCGRGRGRGMRRVHLTPKQGFHTKISGDPKTLARQVHKQVLSKRSVSVFRNRLVFETRGVGVTPPPGGPGGPKKNRGSKNVVPQTVGAKPRQQKRCEESERITMRVRMGVRVSGIGFGSTWIGKPSKLGIFGGTVG